ncbi:MAG: sigma-54-dependent Fis family transcriptional regulator, partial [Deltaproteobacteria bacterium]|nr:sigma-54-dependent Fis family transcriptional regulator [Deltaproteobacteria bacterium]
ENGFVIGVLGISRDVTAHYNERVSAGEFQKEDYSSGAMTRVIDQCKNVAKSNSTVLLLGETGAGKNYLARLIHNQSAGRGAPLILVNVTGLPEGLVESELFGYERGGHATAKAAKPGLLELANSGTFVFDEIGDLPLNIQAKLLSFLDSNSFRRLGGTREITVNARMIAATNRDLEKEVLEGRFRQDLFYRLNSIVIQVPPLRERMEDLPRIVSKISKKLREQIPPLHVPPFSASIMEKLKDYSWPGNIRELERLLERVAVLGSVAIDRFLVDISEAPDGSVKANSFQAAEGGSNDRHEEWVWTTAFPRGRKYADVEKELRRALFEEALRRSGGNVQEAARLLGMAREVLSRQLKKMRIDRDQLSQGDKP